METFSALLAICVGNSSVPGQFPTQRPVTRRFDVYCARLSKQSWGWWFETQLRPLWRHRNVLCVTIMHTVRTLVWFGLVWMSRRLGIYVWLPGQWPCNHLSYLHQPVNTLIGSNGVHPVRKFMWSDKWSWNCTQKTVPDAPNNPK